MKYLITLLYFLTTLSIADTLKLEIRPNGTDNIVMYYPDDWVYVTDEANYKIYISKGEPSETENGLLLIHSLTQFDTPQSYNFMDKNVTKIFSYAAIDCSSKRLYLLGDLYVAEDLSIQYSQFHEMGAYISFLDKEGTARNAVWKVVCNTSV